MRFLALKDINRGLFQWRCRYMLPEFVFEREGSSFNSHSSYLIVIALASNTLFPSQTDKDS